MMRSALLGRPRRALPLARLAHPAWLLLLLALPALLLTAVNLAHLPAAEPAMAQALLQEAFLPRLVASCLAGAALALAGALLQQALRNPLAEPATLGVTAGAQLALTVATLFAPAFLAWSREGVALIGGAAATALVLALAWRHALTPIALILAGLIVTFHAGALAGLLTLLHHDYLQSVFIWSSGSLVQNGWDEVARLLPRVALLALLAAPLARPLGLLAVEEAGARSLGLPVGLVRLLAVGLAVAAAALVTSAVGVIGFVGIAAPTLSRLAGARRFGARLLWAPPLGAALLWLTDQLVQLWSGPDGALIPTGAVTAMLGAPLLLWLLRVTTLSAEPPAMAGTAGPRRGRGTLLLLLGLLLLAAALAWLIGGGADGWRLSWGRELLALAPWRGPRIVAALAAGVLLAAAGTVLQRLTGNAMASPEILGLSSGAVIAAVLLLLLWPEAGHGLRLLAGTAGAVASFGLVLLLARGKGQAGDGLLLGGVVLGTAMTALTTVLLATGDPRLLGLLTWLAGSTYAVGPSEALLAAVLAAAILALLPLARSWLEILPLGEASARALGLDLARVRLLLLLLAATATAAATLLVGPLSFVGLMAPHAARLLGLQRAVPQLLGAALLGALVMGLGDWLGRNLLFPYQIPAGLVASLAGGSYLMLLMLGRAR